jgi:HEAT repeat protein
VRVEATSVSDTEAMKEAQASVGRTKLRVNVKSLLVLVACCAAIIWSVRVTWDHTPLNRMVSGLRSGSSESRRQAARDLGSAGPDELEVAIPALITALGDEDSTVAMDAAHGLGMDVLTSIRAKVEKSPVVPASEALAHALSDERFDVRVAAIRALGLIGGRAEIPPPAALIAALRKDKSPKIRAAAALALGRFQSDVDEAVRPLLDALVEDVVEVRADCNGALASTGFRPSAKLVPDLIHALREGRDTRERYRAASLLGRVGSGARDAIPALIVTLKQPLAPQPVELPPTMEGPGGTAMVIAPQAIGQPPPKEETKDWDPACSSARALGLIAKGTGSADQVVAALSEALKSEYVWRRGEAARGLMALGREGAASVPALAAALTEALAPGKGGNESWIPQALARVAPGSPGAADAVKSLILALDSKHEGTQLYSVRALGAIGPAASAAAPHLRKIADGDDGLLSSSASSALRSIEGKAPQAGGATSP